MATRNAEPEPPDVPRQKSHMSLKSTATRLCHRIGTVRPINRVLANIYTQPLHAISVNPFVNLWQPSQLEMLRVWTIGIFMVIIRIVPMIFCILLACLQAKFFLGIIALLNRWNIDSEPFRQVARDICFTFMRAGFFFAGFYWIRVVDLRRDKNRFAPIITVAPHSSFFDILIILKLKRPTFVSKAENKQVPLVGNVLRLCKGIYVDRSDKNSRQNTINEIRNRANNDEQILIFPEGTCANRSSLIQFKMGAFIPKLPVQPIIARWDACDHMDSVTWSWEGPGAASLFINSLTRISTNLEITILPEYAPNNEEKANTRLFAENVSRLMCHDLGVLQSYYSYDDVPLMPVAKDIRLFRSPACISLLKLCYKVLQKKAEIDKVQETSKQSNVLKVVNESAKPEAAAKNQKVVQMGPGAAVPPLRARVGGILGVGEDVEHAQVVAEMYYPKNYHRKSNKSCPPVILEREKFLQHRWDKPTLPLSLNGLKQDEFQYLPISGARRRLFRPDNLPPPNSAQENKQRRIYSAFCQFIEHCLTHLETHFEYRMLESSEDLIKLLDLKRFVHDRSIDSIVNSLRLSSIFVDLLKIIEYSVSSPVTSAHLLVILHLCDVREHDMWARLDAAITIIDMMREASKDVDNAGSKVQMPNCINPTDKSKLLLNSKAPLVNLDELHTLLWYSLGLQEFNDQFFVNREFDLKYLRTNLGRTFHRAVAENASQLLD